MSNRVKAFLTVSLVLNVLFIGILIGSLSGDFKEHRKMRADMHSSIDNLPEEKAKLVKKTMRNLHKETKKTRKQVRKTRKNINQIISAPEFDVSAYDAEIKKLQDLQAEIMDKFGKATKELALQMEQDEREVIAELLKKRTFKHRRHGGKYGEKSPPRGLEQPPPF